MNRLPTVEFRINVVLLYRHATNSTGGAATSSTNKIHEIEKSAGTARETVLMAKHILHGTCDAAVQKLDKSSRTEL